MNTKDYIDQYMTEPMEIVNTVDRGEIAKAVDVLKEVKANEGRLFILGVGLVDIQNGNFF